MYLGIDLGTSALKILLVDDHQWVIDQASVPLQVQRPRPLWSEQDPEAWWHATDTALQQLRERRATELKAVRAVGLTGQMHGAVMLDGSDAVVWEAYRALERYVRRDPAQWLRWPDLGGMIPP